ncbi:spore coat protein [Xylanibacillus composti]|uniref:Spore coat protein F-like protein YraD n=1 Tax=Xylanibacillus composti TaxID=1572762 RepID=A0A8J4M2B0_9BACL|nr:spore coat protein [Xylanibacillus composti]MDT9726115.1 spore coat protein [Xylanibacillus composti]GIQ68737.1 spore coat protein F-like protein YraD [Xylanibacillus composti]
MNTLIEHLTGMHTLTDQVVAMDLLISAKSGVRNYAMAATEAGTPEVKELLMRHLEEAIDMHERIFAYMMEQGQYHPWNVNEQIEVDLKNSDTALRAPTL